MTVQLDGDTIRKAKILAATKGTSVSRLVASTIEELVARDGAYQAAREKALALLKKGFPLGGGPYASRDELHER